MGLMFQWRKMGNKETIHLKYIKPGSNVVSLPVNPVDLYRVFQKFNLKILDKYTRETIYKQ